MLVIFLRCRLWSVGACAFHIQLAKRTLRTSTNVASHLFSFYQLQKVSSPCATTWYGLHCLQSGAWARSLLPTGVLSCQQYPVLVKIASHSVRLPDIRLTVAAIVSVQRPTYLQRAQVGPTVTNSFSESHISRTVMRE